MPWLIDELIGHAVHRLPEDQRKHVVEAWKGHVNEVPGDIGKVLVAARISCERSRRPPAGKGVRRDMTAEIDIWRTANLLTKRHGEDAGVIAAQRSAECLASGDVPGQIVWKRIAAAILELRRSQPRNGESLN